MRIFMSVFRNSSLAFLLMVSFLFIGEVRAEVYGDWKVSSSTDDFTDEYSIDARHTIVSAAGYVGLFGVSCSNGDELYISLFDDKWGLSRLRSGRVSVKLRVDKKDPISGISGTLLSGRFVVINDDDSIAMLIQQMKKGNKMLLRITDNKGNVSPIYKVSLKGFTKAYNHVVRDCKKNN